MNLKHLTREVGKFVTEQSPQILTILGVAGVGATVYFTHKAALEGRSVVFKENVLRGEKDGNHAVYLTRREEIEKIWKLYIPAVTTGVMTVGCIVAANRVQARRMAALAAAYGVLSGDFDEYRNKALEALGVKKGGELEEKIAKDKMSATPALTTPLDGSKSWFLDENSMRPFPSTMETVKKAQNDLNYLLNNNRDADLNDFWDKLGLDNTAIGNLLGWQSGDIIEIVFTPVLMDEGGAATAFRFAQNPRPKGRK